MSGSARRRRRRGLIVGVVALALAAPVAAGLGPVAVAEVAGLAATPSAPAVVRGNDWYLRRSLTAGSPEVSFRFGLPTDHPLFGDWDGDGTATPGLFRNGQWLLRDKVWGGGVDRTVGFGRPGDIPVTGDWDGDGDDDLAVFRAGRWLFDIDRNGSTDRTLRFGLPTDTPAAGDWNGTMDGSAADLPGLRRGSRWYLLNAPDAGGGSGTSFGFGAQAGDVPVAGRWQSGAGIDQIGVVRGTDWLLRHSHSGGSSDQSFGYGQTRDFFLTWGGAAQSLSQPVRHYTYKVGVKGRVNYSLEKFADVARQTLNDQRGWTLGRLIRYSRVYSGTSHFRLWLATGEEVAKADPVCDKEWSCRVGNDVYINITRWNNGTDAWSSRPLPEYRQYIFMHEVGHWLGLKHSSCPSPGAIAPVLMQQSISLGGCKVNLWPTQSEKKALYDLRVGAAATSASGAESPVEAGGAEAE